MSRSHRELVAYRIVGWGLVGLGVLHLGVALATYRSLSEDLLWFAGTGIAVLLAGALNLCIAAGLTGPGARAIITVSVIANLALSALALSFSILTRWTQPQGMVLLAFFVSASILGARRLLYR